jgi:hypothetical protein
MWTAIFERFVTDQVALVVHIYLLGGASLATIMVGAGIIWESGPLEVHAIAHRLVIWGIVAETLCSIILFTFDEGISSAQQSKIIALETRIAPRVISKEQYEIFKQLSGKYAAINIASEANLEASTFSFQITAPLSDAGISVHIYSVRPGAQWTGILVAMENVPNNPSDEPLLKAMSDAKLSVGWGKFWNMAPTAPHDIPLILVGEKSVQYAEPPYFGKPKAAPAGDEKK